MYSLPYSFARAIVTFGNFAIALLINKRAAEYYEILLSKRDKNYEWLVKNSKAILGSLSRHLL